MSHLLNINIKAITFAILISIGVSVRCFLSNFYILRFFLESQVPYIRDIIDFFQGVIVPPPQIGGKSLKVIVNFYYKQSIYYRQNVVLSQMGRCFSPNGGMTGPSRFLLFSYLEGCKMNGGIPSNAP